MKISRLLYISVVLTLLFVGCQSSENRSESKGYVPEETSTAKATAVIGTYGSEISTDLAIPADMVLNKMGDQDKANLKVEGEIKEVCQMKGCWMTMDLGNGQSMRVTFKDYGFFVPKDVSGLTAVVEGEVVRESVDVATLKHYAEDEGKSDEEIAMITEPQVEINFVASGVVILE